MNIRKNLFLHHYRITTDGRSDGHVKKNDTKNPIIVFFADDKNTRSDTFYRWFNELPVPLLIGVIIFAVVKPF